MSRRRELTKYITRDQLGIEIGPWFNPLAPKAAGYKCLVLDILGADALRKKAAEDPNIPKETITNIEEVDLPGSCTSIAELVAEKHQLGTFDYILSSHNFEHLANPILFLHGCEKVLKRGGILSMAVPDRRVCFDYFRPVSTLPEWLEAYFEGRIRPTMKQVFAHHSLSSRYEIDGHETSDFSLEDDPRHILPVEQLHERLIEWDEFRQHPDENYRDTHCSVFTPASFELLLRELQFLGLTGFEIIETSKTCGTEFYIHLRNSERLSRDAGSTKTFYDLRRNLMHRVNDEASANSIHTFELRLKLRAAQRFGGFRTIADRARRLPFRFKARYSRRVRSWRSRILRFVWPLRRKASSIRNFARHSPDR